MNNIRSLPITIFLFLCSFFITISVHAEPITSTIDPLTREASISKVNINQASATELAEKLNGIGLSKAKKIVEYREKFGPFVSIEQLKEVSGIGQSIIDRNIDKLIL